MIVVCFDNDLGPRETCGEGYDAFCYLEAYLRVNRIPLTFALHAQTNNTSAKQKLEAGFRNLYTWSQNVQPHHG